MNAFRTANFFEKKYNLLKKSQDNQVSDEVKKYIKDYITDRDGLKVLQHISRNYGDRGTEGKSYLDGTASEIQKIYDEIIDIENNNYESKDELVQKLENIRSIILSLYISSGEDKYADYHTHYFNLAQLFWYTFPIRKNSLGQTDRSTKDQLNTTINRLKNYLSGIANRIKNDIYPKLNVLKKYDKESKTFTSPVSDFTLDEDSTEPLNPSEVEKAFDLFGNIINIPDESYLGWNKYLNSESKEKIRKAFRSYVGVGAGIEGTSKAQEQISRGGIYGPEITVTVEYYDSPTGKSSHRKVITKENLIALESVKKQILKRRKDLGEYTEPVKYDEYKPTKEEISKSHLGIKDSEVIRKLKKDGYGKKEIEKWLKLSDRIREKILYSSFLRLLDLSDQEYNRIAANDSAVIEYVKSTKPVKEEKVTTPIIEDIKPVETISENKDEEEEEAPITERNPTGWNPTASIRARKNLLLKLCNIRG